MSILIVDDAQIAELNQKYRNKQGPTNVLSFPMNPDIVNEDIPQLLGDVVISVETARREGKSSGISLEKRLEQLLVHGILHLFNYDHEKGSEAADIMERKSNELLKLIEQ